MIMMARAFHGGRQRGVRKRRQKNPVLQQQQKAETEMKPSSEETLPRAVLGDAAFNISTWSMRKQKEATQRLVTKICVIYSIIQ
jgi:hypothetical protein